MALWFEQLEKQAFDDCAKRTWLDAYSVARSVKKIPRTISETFMVLSVRFDLMLAGAV
jgi:hypothetical protein